MPAEGSLGIDLAPFARALAAETDAEARADLQGELESDWRTRTDPEWAARYAGHCPVRGIAPGAYTWRRVFDPVVGDVLAGIHFLGLDGAEPFVGVRAWTRPDPARLDDLARLLAREWAAFRPKSFRIFRARGRWEPPGATIDQHLVVGSIESLRREPPPPGCERVTLLPRGLEEAEALAARVAHLFEEVYAARPGLRKRVTPANADDLRACAEAGALFEVEIDGARAGVVSARAGRRLAWAGAEMVEEVLEPAWWGEGLGAALQRRLLDALPDRIGPYLWGTIDGANEASLKTAQRVGRRIVGSWWFVPLP